MNLMLTPEQIRAIPTTDYPTPAQRPAYSCLDSYKLTETFGLSLPDWADDFALNFAAVRAGCV
jgi:dTDP-4-dehydrorhamnose reductase